MQMKWALLKDHSRISGLLFPVSPWKCSSLSPLTPWKPQLQWAYGFFKNRGRSPTCWQVTVTEDLLPMGFTCGIKGSLQGLHKSLDFRHILLQGLSSEEGVDFGSFMTMFTIYCHQPGKSMINYFRGGESNTNSLGNAHKTQKLVFQRSLAAFSIFNALLLPTTSASSFSGLKIQNPGKHTYFLKCISW